MEVKFYKRWGDTPEDRAKLEAFKSEDDFRVVELGNGVHRLSKRCSSLDEAMADFQEIQGAGHYQLLGTSDLAPDVFENLFRPDRIMVVADPKPPDSSPDAAAEPGRNDSKKELPAEPAAPVAASSDGTAQVVHEGAALLHSPPHLWERIYAHGNGAEQLAPRIANDLARERVSLARAVAWSVAPESELFRRSGGRASDLARRMLEVREGLTDQDTELRQLSVEARKQDNEAQRALISLLKEFEKQVKKWTSFANWGLGILIGTVLFSAGMTVWLFLLPADKIQGWEMATAIFALALFAVSPAVLLLRERPLEGIDKWMPSGGSGGTDTSSSGSGDSASGGGGNATATATSQKTTSGGGPRIGGHKGERPN